MFDIFARGDMVATQNKGIVLLRHQGDHPTDLHRKTGEGEGIRTLDPSLGKVGLERVTLTA